MISRMLITAQVSLFTTRASGCSYLYAIAIDEVVPKVTEHQPNVLVRSHHPILGRYSLTLFLVFCFYVDAGGG